VPDKQRQKCTVDFVRMPVIANAQAPTDKAAHFPPSASVMTVAEYAASNDCVTIDLPDKVVKLGYSVNGNCDVDEIARSLARCIRVNNTKGPAKSQTLMSPRSTEDDRHVTACTLHDMVALKSELDCFAAKLEEHPSALLNHRDEIRGIKADESTRAMITEHSAALHNHRDEIRTLKQNVPATNLSGDLKNIEQRLAEQMETHSAALINHRDEILALRSNLSMAGSNAELEEISTRLNEHGQALINHRDTIRKVSADSAEHAK
jgi:hypothetical protein